jgi:hypothetical protein
VKTLREAIAMAARVGSLQQSAAQSHGRSATVNQMDVDDGDGSNAPPSQLGLTKSTWTTCAPL